MTLEQMLAAAREALTAKLAERKTAQDALMALRASIDTDTSITPEIVEGAIARRDAIDGEVDALRGKVTDLEGEIAREAEVLALSEQRNDTGVRPAYDGVARVGSEKRTYTPDNVREGVSFIADVMARADGDFSAAERLSRHMAEERVERGGFLSRDVGTGAFAGLTVPQYLTDLVAPAVAKGRPLADNCRKLDLPADGMTVNISRITTATAAAVQATENAGVQETDADDTLLTVNVRTIAGQQDVSRQAAERSVGAEVVLVEDLVRRYHTALDNSIINDDGTLGTHLGIRSTSSISTATLTDSSPTQAEAFGALWEIQSTIESAVYMGATHLVMHPRRWNWFASGVGTDQTFVQSANTGAQLFGAEVSKAYGAGVRGFLAGLPVIVDANVPTNVSSTQDVILAVNSDELFLWEQPGSPLFIRAEQTGVGNLSIKLVVYGYSAFTAGRYPAAHGVISGSGLAAPTTFGKTIS